MTHSFPTRRSSDLKAGAAIMICRKINEGNVRTETTTPTTEDEIGTSRRSLFAGALGAAAVAGAATAMLAPKAAEARVDPSNSKLQEVLARGVLRVGTGSTNPPWHFEDDTGKLVDRKSTRLNSSH